MGMRALDLIWQRVEASRSESIDALFDGLLYAAEAFLKTYAAAIIAGLPDDRDRHRYRLCHRLVRAAGIGEWDDALADVATGPASTHLLAGAGRLQRELTERESRDSWIYDSTARLHKALRVVIPDVESLPTRVDGRRWFTLLVQFRNKTRGHGAPRSEEIAKMVLDVEASLRLYMEKSALTALPWAYVRRNLSGKYHVVPLCGTSPGFERLKGNRLEVLQDGIYVDAGALCRVELIDTTPDLTDFYYPNGHFGKKSCEWLSYISGTRRAVDGTAYLAPATTLPPSGTDGGRALAVVGECLANLPPRPSDYVTREGLETELSKVLMNDRHPVVALVGRGGIGKTSLALEVLYRIAADAKDRFLSIVWLSARDIDLLPQGPKLVQPSALSPKDMAKQFAALFQPEDWDQKGFNAEAFMAECLSSSKDAPLLLVFDNFETVQQPVDLFQWLDAHIRSPNKILITTRHRDDFRGEYPVEVGGMTERQCNLLVDKTAGMLGIRAAVTPEFRRDVYRESEGHPYVVKVLVGEAADGKSIKKIERIVAGKDALLDALFERTYKRLSPAAKRVFMTLSNWRSLVPQVALEAAFLRPHLAERIDVFATTAELRRVSFLDEHRSPDDHVFFSVPLVAGVFGKRKLAVSPDQSSVDGDLRFLRRFGAMMPTDVRHGLKPRIDRLFSSISEDMSTGRVELPSEMPVLELIARHYPPAWMMIADLWRETLAAEASIQTIEALSRYLQATDPGIDHKVAWERIATVHREQGDWRGFVNGHVQIAELPAADLITVSASVNTFNSVSRRLDDETRVGFANRLAMAMEPKLADGDATDCSRLAWLLIACGKVDRAAEIVNCGLQLDRSNEHCRNLNFRIWSQKLTSSRKSSDIAGLVEAVAHLAPDPDFRFGEISEAAGYLSSAGREAEMASDTRHVLAHQLASAMEPRIQEGNATDCSRLAWLYLQTGEQHRASDIVERGLRLDPRNEHCVKLRTRLNGPTL